MNPTTPQWLTMTEYAQFAHLSLSKVKRMKLTGALPCWQDGRCVRIPAQALDYQWLHEWQTSKEMAHDELARTTGPIRA